MSSALTFCCRQEFYSKPFPRLTSNPAFQPDGKAHQGFKVVEATTSLGFKLQARKLATTGILYLNLV